MVSLPKIMDYVICIVLKQCFYCYIVSDLLKVALLVISKIHLLEYYSTIKRKEIGSLVVM